MKSVTAYNISKKYGKVQALKEVSLEVEKGEIFGIIGPDGAGKTTLFRILTTLILANEGTATVDDLDVVKDYKAIRDRVGYMPGKFSLYQDLTVEENLSFFATVFHTTIEENYDLVKDIYQQIEPFKKRKAGDLSGGMKQKLALSCALIHKPSVLFLDEPTTGVDPVSRKEFWEMLKKLKKEGISILVSTPYMDEAELCDRIALIQNGQFLKTDTPENIVKDFGAELWSVQSSSMYRLLTDLRKNEAVDSCFAFGDAHHITLKREFIKRELIKSDPLNNDPLNNEPSNNDPLKSDPLKSDLSKSDLSKNELFNNDPYSEEYLRIYLTDLGHTDIQIKPVAASIEDCFMRLSQHAL